MVCATRDTWSRSARRRPRGGTVADVGSLGPVLACVLYFTSQGGAETREGEDVRLMEADGCGSGWDWELDEEHGETLDGDARQGQVSREPETALEVRWVFGYERPLFESFAGHVARTMGR